MGLGQARCRLASMLRLGSEVAVHGVGRVARLGSPGLRGFGVREVGSRQSGLERAVGVACWLLRSWRVGEAGWRDSGVHGRGMLGFSA